MMAYWNIILRALCFAPLLNVITAYEINQDWINFKRQFNKSYESITMESNRYKIFASNKQKIANHNKLYEKGLVTYEMGINRFADALPREFQTLLTGLNIRRSYGFKNLQQGKRHLTSPARTLVKSTAVDWRNQGAVTRVKDQGMCGSCWAFSAAGALEGQYFRHHGDLLDLSEQNLLDCSTNYGNKGCDGGDPVQAYKYIKDNGIQSSRTYPYKGDEQNCRNNPKLSVATVTDYVQVEESEEELAIAVANVGPISVCVDASNLMNYKSGVYYDEDCSSSFTNHAVLAVGYGSDPRNGDYWLIKNSWGTTWGMDGYMKLARNRRNHCGIASYATYPLVELFI